MASQLETFRGTIEECCRRGDTDAKIVRKLEAGGCGIGRERIRTWIRDETRAGRLPARQPSGRGRPPARKDTAPKPSPTSPGPLFGTTASPLATAETFDPAPFAEAYGIPVHQNGGLDLVHWGSRLGTESVKILSELELFLLEALENPWRDHSEKWTRQWVESVQQSAKRLREEMMESAKMHELIGGMKTQKP